MCASASVPTAQEVRTGHGTPDGSYGVFAPFRHPRTNAPFHARDSFDIGGLGYRYDALPSPPASTHLDMTAMPTFACFESIDINQMEQSRGLHVLVMPVAASEGWVAAPTEAELVADPHYAGFGSIFGLFSPPGGRGVCGNCQTRSPFDVSVDVSQALIIAQAGGQHRADVVVKVVVRNEDGALVPLEDTPVPAPTLRGPTFAAAAATDVCMVPAEGQPNDRREVESLQKFLAKNGYKATPVIDGEVGVTTAEAIRKFQAMHGLQIDGVVGPLTRQQIIAPQYDAARHMMDPAAAQGEAAAQNPFPAGTTLVLWTLGWVPGYLSREAVVAELQDAFSPWAQHTSLRFVFAPPAVEADAADVPLLRMTFDQDGGESDDCPALLLSPVCEVLPR
jgi:hypothetical protein